MISMTSRTRISAAPRWMKMGCDSASTIALPIIRVLAVLASNCCV